MTVTPHRRPGVKARLPFMVALIVLKPLIALCPMSDSVLHLLKWIDRAADRGPDAPGIDRTRITLAGRPADLVVPAGAALSDGDAAILYLHGGAFIFCGPATHRRIAGRLAGRLQLPVYSLDYRQLPEAGVGASVQDAILAYQELLRRHGRVIVAGDSAGGYLCGKVIEYAHAKGLPKPVAYIGYSPMLNLDLSRDPDSTSRHDAYLPKRTLVKLTPKFDRGPIAFTGARNVLAVPAEAFPPTLLITARDEFPEPDAVKLAEKLTAAGVVADLHRYEWQLHAFPALAFSRDAAAAVTLSADFARDALATLQHDRAIEQTG